MSFIEIVRPRRSDGHSVRVSIQMIDLGPRLVVRIPEVIASVARLRAGLKYTLLFGVEQDFGRVALRPDGRNRLRKLRDGSTLQLATHTAPWRGGVRDRGGRQMMLIQARRRPIGCLHITDDERAPLIVVLPEDWFAPVEGAAVFAASEWSRRRAHG